MKLADRIAAWFGYVPAERLVDMTLDLPKPAIDDMACEYCGSGYYGRGPIYFCRCGRSTFHDHLPMPATETTVKPRPQIIVSADFKRGIPCS